MTHGAQSTTPDLPGQLARRRFMQMAGLALGGAAAGGVAATHARAMPVGAGQVAQYWGRLLDIPFQGENGRTHTLSDWAGQPMLVNFYATWCAPCRQEMPSMDALAALRPNFAVLPISVERGGTQQLRRFYTQLGLRSLGVYQDQSGALTQAAQVWGYPTTLLVNAQGAEIDRVFDALHWSSPQVVAWLDLQFGGGGKSL